ncbi:HAD-like protein [Schizopora paradoxa]|uniref:HAD-like protein n=1 Tax=Schizopora paradoxa TaxID=27342 RepID=A0A0H2SE70_9AGAM|nr:HAD-like protein [Schizopora paradoxa]
MQTTITVDAILFDMDGTLIDSTPGVLKAWATFANDYGLDADTVAHATHGRRLYDTLKEYCNIQDEDKLHEEIKRFEQEVLDGGPVPLAGAIPLLTTLNTLTEPAPSRWTIVTSASNFYAPQVLARASIPLPSSTGIITSNDVARGKPHPDPYLAGARACNVDPHACLVVEDAPSGVRSGHAAGSKVVAVCTSHSRQAMVDASPDFVISDLTKMSVACIDGKFQVTLDTSE